MRPCRARGRPVARRHMEHGASHRDLHRAAVERTVRPCPRLAHRAERDAGHRARGPRGARDRRRCEAVSHRPVCRSDVDPRARHPLARRPHLADALLDAAERRPPRVGERGLLSHGRQHHHDRGDRSLRIHHRRRALRGRRLPASDAAPSRGRRGAERRAGRDQRPECTGPVRVDRGQRRRRHARRIEDRLQRSRRGDAARSAAVPQTRSRRRIVPVPRPRPRQRRLSDPHRHPLVGGPRSHGRARAGHRPVDRRHR